MCTVGAVVLGVLMAKTGKLAPIAEKFLPALEDGITAVWGDTLRMVKAPPKSNFYQLKNGLEIQLDRDVTVFGKKTDMISLVHPVSGEAQLLKDGSRIVLRPGVGNFYDEAGKGIHMAFPSADRPTVWFNNEELTPVNKKAFRSLENSFLTGSEKPLRVPDLFDRVTKI
jgi:hypothetical protein